MTKPKRQVDEQREPWPTSNDLFRSKDETAQAILRFPRSCPMCGAEMETARYEKTLGHRVTYWCGKSLNDNAGRIQGDWRGCGVKERVVE